MSAIQSGYRCFITGGAIGFDTLSAQTVLNAKQEHRRKKIKLILAIPCPEQADGWEQADIDVYEHIKILADSVVYVSTHNKKGCMHKRNRYMVDNSSLCIAYMTRQSGGTAYTVKYAQENNKKSAISLKIGGYDVGNSNKTLSAASKAKQDEFYTQLSDIENELKHYKEHFKGKVVFCNCDDPYESNFFKYFAMNFNHLGLKKLICTCYATSPIMYKQLTLFGEEEELCEEITNKKPYKIEITEVKDLNGDGAVDLQDIELLLKSVDGKPELLKGDGDFRSDECVELLKQADVVVTNPPFSLFREYVAQLIEYNKKFVIIGNKNAITYKEIFPLLKKNKMWIGYKAMGGSLWFTTPDGFGKKSDKIVDGIKLTEVPCCWYTNLDIQKRHENLILYRNYNSEEYPTYDNYNAIEVSKVSEIPEDYYGVMGVPITFMDKYNPEQFEIIGLLQSSNEQQAGIPILRTYNDFKEMRQDMTYTGSSGGKANGNPVLKGKSAKGNFLYNPETNEYVHSAYARITIKRKK